MLFSMLISHKIQMPKSHVVSYRNKLLHDQRLSEKKICTSKHELKGRHLVMADSVLRLQ